MLAVFALIGLFITAFAGKEILPQQVHPRFKDAALNYPPVQDAIKRVGTLMKDKEFVDRFEKDRIFAAANGKIPTPVRDLMSGKAKSTLLETTEEELDSSYNYYADYDSTGYFIQSYYPDTTCSQSPVFEMGYFYGACISYPEYQISMKYVVPKGSCANTTLISYVLAGCNSENFAYEQRLFLDNVACYGHSDFSFAISCTNTTDVPVNFDGVLGRFYEGVNNCTSQPLEYSNIATGYCASGETDDFTYSFYQQCYGGNDYNTTVYLNSTTCTNASYVTSYMTYPKCLSEYYYYYNDYYYGAPTDPEMPKDNKLTDHAPDLRVDLAQQQQQQSAPYLRTEASASKTTKVEEKVVKAKAKASTKTSSSSSSSDKRTQEGDEVEPGNYYQYYMEYANFGYSECVYKGTTILTNYPTRQPTRSPTAWPSTIMPTFFPTADPSAEPSDMPTVMPSVTPGSPTEPPVASASPSEMPTYMPTTEVPTVMPTVMPTTEVPSQMPTYAPSVTPGSPTAPPVATEVPTVMPTVAPSTRGPSAAPITPTRAPSTIRPSQVPTVTPTADPTFAPAPYPVTIFEASQVLSGISASDFNSDPTNAEVLKATIASCMSGVHASDVLNLVVTDVVSIAAWINKKMFLTTSAQATYDIYIQNVNSSTSYATLSAELASAVDGGTFNTNLQTYATQYGVTDLAGVTSDAVTTENLTPTTASNDDDNSALSTGVIAGIVIGCIVGIVCIVSGVYYAYNSKPAPLQTGESVKSNHDIDVPTMDNPAYQSRTVPKGKSKSNANAAYLQDNL